MPDPKLYPSKHPRELEPYYARHVSAMTSEKLHHKSDIAIQLAWRDAQIAELEAKLREANHWRTRHSNDAEAFGKQSNENWQRARELETKLDEQSDHIDRLRAEHDETRGYRQLAEQDRAELRALLRRLAANRFAPADDADGAGMTYRVHAVEWDSIRALLDREKP